MTEKQARARLRKAVARLKLTKEGYNKEGGHWRAALALLDEVDGYLAPDVAVKPKAANIGSIETGGASLLKMSLTHETSGLPLYPALDGVWKAGQRVIAPESGTVTKHSGGGSGGFSLYLNGDSGVKYYFQHMTDAGRASLGKIAKGARIGIVGSPKVFPGQRVAHAHVGINVESLAGKGKQLKYGKNGNGPNYTLGSPSVGEQLKALL